MIHREQKPLAPTPSTHNALLLCPLFICVLMGRGFERVQSVRKQFRELDDRFGGKGGHETRGHVLQ